MELFDAICAKCGKPCQVPFRPNGKKPVYCSECFGGTRQDVPSGDFRRSDRFEQREFRPQRAPDGGLDGIKRQLDSIEGKLDELMDALTESEES